MVWNHTDAATLTMKQLNLYEIKSYLEKIRDKELYAYGVYQIEADGRSLFEKIEGDENSIMCLQVEKIKKCRQHVLNLLTSITPNGKEFADGVSQTLKSCVKWKVWKYNKKCPTQNTSNQYCFCFIPLVFIREHVLQGTPE